MARARDPSDPYWYEPEPSLRAAPRRRVTITPFTVILVAFAIVSGWQISQAIADNSDEAWATILVVAGKEITVDYEARLADGALVDTTMFAVAQEANRTQGYLLRGEGTYKNLTFTLGAAPESLGTKFEQALLGHAAGQRLVFTVPASEGGGDWGSTTTIPRTDGPYSFEYAVTVGKQHGLDLGDVEARIGPLANGTKVHLPWERTPWEQVVDDVNRATGDLTYHHDITPGYSFTVPVFEGNVEVVLSDAKDEITYRLNPTPGSRFAVRSSAGGTVLGLTPGSYRVDSLADAEILLSYSPSENPFLVGRDLTYTVHIRSVTTPRTTGASP